MATKPSAKSVVPKPPSQPACITSLKSLRIVIRAAQGHSSWIEKRCGINGAQLWILKELEETPGLRIGEVAEKLAIHQTTTSNLVNGLLKKSYVEKHRLEADQRVVKLMLSKKGAAVLKKAPEAARGLLPEALNKLDRASLTKLEKGLAALVQIIDDVDEEFGLEPLPFTL